MSPSIESAAVGVATQPAKGLVEALIGPKIAKIKKWAILKDIEGDTTPEKLA